MGMKLIADSGSTKTDWAVIHEDQVVLRVRSQGINPNVQSAEDISAIIRATKSLQPYYSRINEIFYYGAGCAGKQQQAQLSALLQQTFQHAHIQVESDLSGAVHAVVTAGEACIVGILGTGSNSCMFNGAAIQGDTFSLGFILGDEGSGSWIGKQLIMDHWYARMPAHLRELFSAAYDMNRQTILQGVYGGSAPAAYLASHAPFAFAHMQEAYIQTLLQSGIQAFVAQYICRFPNAMPVHMVGSIAFLLQEMIQASCRQHGYVPGVFIREPMDGLIIKHTVKH